jgi:hypothetical protein
MLGKFIDHPTSRQKQPEERKTLKMGAPARRRPKDKKFFLSPSTFFPILEEGPPWSLLSSN